MKASIKYRVICCHREKYSVSEMCRFFGVSRSGYYGFVWLVTGPTEISLEDDRTAYVFPDGDICTPEDGLIGKRTGPDKAVVLNQR